jgi:hypothetical protein
MPSASPFHATQATADFQSQIWATNLADAETPRPPGVARITGGSRQTVQGVTAAAAAAVAEGQYRAGEREPT